MSVVLIAVALASASTAAAVSSWVAYSAGRERGHTAGYDAGRAVGRDDARRELGPRHFGVGKIYDAKFPIATDVDGEGRICSIYTDTGGIDFSRMKPKARARLGRLVAESNTDRGGA